MKILVTGGAGYIGSSLVRTLASVPEVKEIVVYDNLSRGSLSLFLGPKFAGATTVRFINGDILDRQLLARHMANTAVVFHLAAKVTTPHDVAASHSFEQVNHWGTAEVVSAFEEYSPETSRFVHVSSAAVYGGSPVPATDSTPTAPTSLYGVSKLRGEAQVKRLIDMGRAVTVRIGNVYGESTSMRFDAVINRFAFEANFNKRISVHGSGKQSKAFNHISGVTGMLGALLTSTVPPGTYNYFQRNVVILDMVDIYKSLIPELEFTFIDQHLTPDNYTLDEDFSLKEYLSPSSSLSLEAEFKGILEHFSFS